MIKFLLPVALLFFSIVRGMETCELAKLQASYEKKDYNNAIHELYQLIGYEKGFFRIPCLPKVAERLKAVKASQSALNVWLQTAEASQLLFDVLAKDYFTRYNKTILFVEIGYFLGPVIGLSFIKSYLAQYPDQKKQIEEKLFHQLLQSADSSFLEYLNKIGISFSTHDEDGCTWLMAAAAHNLMPAAQYFLEHLTESSININARDRDGRSALSQALIHEHEDMIDLLLRSGCVLSEFDLEVVRVINSRHYGRKIDIEKTASNGYHHINGNSCA